MYHLDQNPNSRPPHILVVDDEPMFVELVCTWLEQADFQVTTAESGKEALSILGCNGEYPAHRLSDSQEPHEHPFDLILLDVMMPDMRGTEVCRHIRACDDTAQIPVLVLTALSSSQTRLEALRAGANDYLTKPFQGVELLARVGNLVRWHRAEREAQEEMRQRNRELNTLNEVASTLNQTLNLNDLLDQTLDAVCRTTGFPWAAIHLMDPSGDCLDLAAQRDAPRSFLRNRQRIPRDDGVLCQVIEQMRPIATQSVIDVQESDSLVPPEQEIVTHTHVLLASKGQPVGLLTVGRNQEQDATSEAAPLLSALGHQIGTAVANAIMFERMQRHSQKLDSLNQVMGLMMSRLNLTSVLSVIVAGLVEHWNAALARIWLVEGTGGDQRLVLRASAGLSANLEGPLSQIPLNSKSTIAQLSARRQEIVSVDLESDKEFVDQDWMRREGFRSFAGYPLFFKDQQIGVMAVFWREPLHHTDLELLRTFAHQAAAAIENSGLYAREQQRVAELTELTHELARSQAQLVQSEKMAAAGRLAASLAHEINNPLQAIHNCLTLAQRFPLDVREHSDFLALAGNEVERLITLVRDILEFCRPSRGHRVLVDVNDLIEHVIALTQKKLQHSDIELHLNLMPDLEPVRVVSDQISQVVLNLIINAIEAMPEGGRLGISSKQAKGYVQILISDTGPGLSQNQIDHLFEPFFTTKPAGTGLGLAISFGIVERHGGTIQVTSKEGAGANFVVSLPIASADERNP